MNEITAAAQLAEQSAPATPAKKRGRKSAGVYKTNAERQAAYRARRIVVDADEYLTDYDEVFSSVVEERNQFVKQFTKTVEQELRERQIEPYRTDRIEERPTEVRMYFDDVKACLWAVAILGFAYEQTHGLERFLRETDRGRIVCGCLHEDRVGIEPKIVFTANYSRLKQSPTFNDVYFKVLAELDKRYGNDQAEHFRDIRLELNGVYKLNPNERPQKCQVRQKGSRDFHSQEEFQQYTKLLKNRTVGSLEEFRSLGPDEIAKRLQVPAPVETTPAEAPPGSPGPVFQKPSEIRQAFNNLDQSLDEAAKRYLEGQ